MPLVVPMPTTVPNCCCRARTRTPERSAQPNQKGKRTEGWWTTLTVHHGPLNWRNPIAPTVPKLSTGIYIYGFYYRFFIYLRLLYGTRNRIAYRL
jgi:hypothetical protein